ncbi:MAG: HAD family hydrolase [Candidatus Bathyarchaeota archaeon]
MIKAVTFDLWSTLLCAKEYEVSRSKIMLEVLEESGFLRENATVINSYEDTLVHFSDLWEKEKKYHVISAKKMVEFMLTRLHVSLPMSSVERIAKGFEETILSDLPPLEEGARKILKHLKDSRKIGLISNTGVTPGRILRRVLDRLEILECIDCTIFSDEIGYTKPHALPFRKAVEQLQVKPYEAIHVGDLLHTDVVGAKRFGMKAVWINRNIDVAESDLKPDYKVEKLSQLLEILAALTRS